MTYYVERSGHFLELRQERFRDQRQSRGGEGHPHDVCAIARDRHEMERMLDLCRIEDPVDWGDAYCNHAWEPDGTQSGGCVGLVCEHCGATDEKDVS